MTSHTTIRYSILFIAIAVLIIITSTTTHAETCIDFFYGTGCPHCASVEPSITALVEDENITVRQHDVYTDRSKAIMLDSVLAERNISQENRAIPAVVIGPVAIIGADNFEDRIHKAINEHPNTACASDIWIQNNSQENAQQSISGITMSALIGAAFVDSINPCAIAVIIILLGGLLVAGDRRKALRSGLAFTAAVYIAYLLFGLGLFSAIQISGLASVVAKIVGVLAIIIGLLNIKDYLWYGGGGFVIEIPRAWRPRLKQLLNAATSPGGAFMAGFAVCLFELPCTGGPYLFILGLLAQQTTFAAALPLLLLYNIVFVLPLLVITISLYYGLTNVEAATAWKERNLRTLHLVAGIIMTGLGIAVIIGI